MLEVLNLDGMGKGVIQVVRVVGVCQRAEPGLVSDKVSVEAVEGSTALYLCEICFREKKVSHGHI
jgi:hypothetical protein